jgi:hypothetical protein
MVDVDYYVDMPGHLARNFRPLVLYTFQPSRAGKAVGEYKYRFHADGRVEYNVAGGGGYNHHVWNWKGDSVGATRTMCGIPLTYSVFSVERKNVDEDHQAILVSPLSKYKGIHAWIAMWRVKTPPLERLNPVDGEFVRISVNGSGGMISSTSRVGGYLASSVDVQVDEAIASAARTTAKLMHATVKSKMASGHSKAKQGECDFTGSEVLLEYHLRGGPKTVMVDIVDTIRSYQWLKTYQAFEPEKPMMVAFMQPLFNGAFVPNKCKNNDERMVEKRIKELKHKPGQITPIMNQVMDEFVNLMSQHIGKLHPVEVEEVYERQNKPSQRRILDDAQHGMAVKTAQVMQKNEAYPSVNDPRAITIINGVDKMAYSQIIYAFADKLKSIRWYAFGKSPREIAAEVAGVCGKALSHADNTDLRRQDGNVDSVARTLERKLMIALFHAVYHLEMLRLMKTQTGLRATTRHGVSYDTDDARASGSAETSAFNTTLTAFIAFLGFRMTRNDRGIFYTADEAWEKLGLYGGDDGITVDQDRYAVEKAATLMGQQLDCDRTKRGAIGVSFLARRYGPDVWHNTEGSDNSCCDIRRQLAKFHATLSLSSKVTPLTKLREKAYAFYLTDKHTPVIGEFVSRTMELKPLKSSEYTNMLKIWNSEVEQDNHYPNFREDWMVSLLMEQIPKYDYDGFKTWIQGASVDDLFVAPQFAPDAKPKAKPGLFALDGDIQGEPEEPVKKEGEPPQNETPPEEDKRSKPKSKKFRQRKKNAYKGAQADGTVKNAKLKGKTQKPKK